MSEAVIWSFFKKKGLSDCGAAGLMGNLYAESGLKPDNLQNTCEKKLGLSDADYTAQVDARIYQDFVHDSAGYGLAQWTFWSRKQKLLVFALSRGKSIGDLEMQLDFLWKELTESYPSLVNILKTAASVRAASDAALVQFERPADQSETAKAAQAAKEAAEEAKAAAKLSETNAKESETAALGAKEDAEAASGEALAAKESAKDDALSAAQAKEDAENAKLAAEQAKTAAEESAGNAAESASRAEQYSGKPPKPQNGTWWIWDAETGAYYDTKISCELQGPIGVGIEDIQLTEGDHSPGSTDVYTVHLTDGSSYNISVYNGRNGTGAGDVLGISFDLVIPKNGWKDGSVTVADSRLLALGTHKYFLTAEEACKEEFIDCNVQPKDITASGFLMFTCDTDPAMDLTVHLIRFELSGSGAIQ